ncbi:hypothetical protein WOLCODRAFT_100182 [Wolfiporia cocos MD-104 SS10]|uniref:Arginyl-tRNA--protein transferase 1 n=1 Tax=Wolfiporia cocos (strain MD-104) TaxID=742152 RepID=A0A2H3JX21_WOLCO|nr:hypothetical protein WOLCODRAFT_100182 [Wolfiporia cocos MD-104 SS10]
MVAESIITVLSPLTPGNSTCGYCGHPGGRSETRSSWHQAECVPLQLSCGVYQKMIDRGFRRSGEYVYKPDLKRSCCPQYTIKLDALHFKPSRGQRQLVNRWNRFVLDGDHEDKIDQSVPKCVHPDVKAKKLSSKAPQFVVTCDIHASEFRACSEQKPKHIFKVTLEPSSFTEEKFALYQCYQKEIHLEDDKSTSDFIRFLVETPLHREAIAYFDHAPDHLPREYGSYHQMYRLDGKLIAMGVIDILPNCVSSVYFMYEKKWERFSLGKLSALREASLAIEMHNAGAEEISSLYMGFYIHSCQKMRYKGQYAPSYLVDPEEYTWHPLEKCIPLLEKYRYVSFAHPDDGLEGSPHHDAMDNDDADGADCSEEELEDIMALKSVRGGSAVVQPVTAASEWRKSSVKIAVSTMVRSLGPKLAEEVIFHFGYTY